MPLPYALDRRSLLKAGAATGALGVVAPALAGTPAAAAPDRTGPVRFDHGVASGDPLPTAVLLWTRVTPVDPAERLRVEVDWEVASDAGFRSVVRSGTFRTGPRRDWTVKVDVKGLGPYTRYWYRFSARGTTSPVGRTQTAAADRGPERPLRLAFVSCSNWTGGYFAAYGHLARRDDLDVVLHLGDYLYEYGNGADRYGPAALAGKRDHVPAREMVTLADHRARHAQYKTDPDLQAAHAAHPWVVIFDDHEVTNDAYDQGAENHTEGAEGDWEQRRALAYQAYLEWMPVRLPDQDVPHEGTRFFRRLSFGPMADLSVIETRQNRTRRASSTTALGEIRDPDRVMMEPEQMAWLKVGLADTSRRWHLVGNQTVFTRVQLDGTLFNVDQWDGYQHDQAELTGAMRRAASDPVVLTGDIHSSWANEIPVDPRTYRTRPRSAAVEFVCPSVTSDGFTEFLGNDEARARQTTAYFQAQNPNVKFLDGVGHGFAVLDVTRDRVQTDFWYVSDRLDPDATLSYGSSWSSARGSRRVTAARGPLPARRPG